MNHTNDRETKPFPEPIAALRRASATIAGNLAYVQKELLLLDPPPDLREHVISICCDFSNALDDVDAEIQNLEVFLTQHSGQAVKCREAIIRRLRGELENLHLLVTSLRKRSAEDAAITGLEILVTESAGNVLYAFNNICDTLVDIAAT